MITITLNQIRDASPCEPGWEKVFLAHKHLGMDVPFPLSSVLDSNDLYDTLWCFNALPEHIEIPKRFAVWCARRVQHLTTDERIINVLDVAERYLDGNATLQELKQARHSYFVVDATADATADAIDYAVYCAIYETERYSRRAAASAALSIHLNGSDIRQKQIEKLRQMLDAD